MISRFAGVRGAASARFLLRFLAMIRIVSSVACLLGVLVSAGPLTAPDARQAAPTPAARGADPRLVERGDYLAHHVAMCVECHSPRDRRGAIIPGEEFRGAPNPFVAPFPGMPWAIRSVNIRGLGDLPEEAVIRLLTTGMGRNGAPPDPPMPQFRMSRADAEAIVAYLRSLR
jgi:mono/diheme cytochrome c family protein